MEAIVTFQSFVATFTDFLSVAIHTILYERDIYPRTSFLSARKYNYAVRQNRHPKVCKWIADAVAAVESELLRGTVERVAVVIYDRSDTPLERFMFDLSRFPFVPVAEQATPLSRTDASGQQVAILPLVDLEEQLRATMSRLSNCGSQLKSLPARCTFTVAIELRNDKEPPIGHPQPWIPVQPQLHTDHSSTGGAIVAGGSSAAPQTTPVRAVAAGDMVFEMWIEEGQAKADALSSSGSSLSI
ncbi:hypothetical protein MBLNU459_g2844t1 [Dothideomycetes sp. NU459]